MKPIRFLTFAEILVIHQDQILNYGGEPGIRDTGLLSSALAMPESTFSGNYFHETIFEKAAAYLFHICQNHPFIDGNKRVALASALVFLDLNQVEINDLDDQLYGLVMRVATGECKKPEIASVLESISQT